jgi:transcription termination/antitermination protein NusG
LKHSASLAGDGFSNAPGKLPDVPEGPNALGNLPKVYIGKSGFKYTEPVRSTPWAQVRNAAVPAVRGAQWYAVHCAGAPDVRVAECAKRVGWRIYAPFQRELRPVPKRRLTASQRNSAAPVMRAVEVPLFPRYPFIHFDLEDPRRHDVFELLGVQGVLCDGGLSKPQPAYMHESVIAALMKRQNEGAIVLGTTVRDLAYSIGEEVRISTGALAGFNGTVEEIPATPLDQLDESARLRLLVSLFGRETVVELSIADIEKL